LTWANDACFRTGLGEFGSAGLCGGGRGDCLGDRGDLGVGMDRELELEVFGIEGLTETVGARFKDGAGDLMGGGGARTEEPPTLIE